MLIETQLVTGPCAYEAMASRGFGASGGSGGFPASGGAECVFIGRTRGEVHPEFGALIRLEYEAYGPMVEKALKEIAESVGRANDCLVVRVAHSQGAVAIGEASVVIQVACGHRGESFVACRAIIERIKEVLPVWKREIWEHGQTFVPGSKVAAMESSDDGNN